MAVILESVTYTGTPETEEQMVRAYRARYPQSRVVSMFKYHLNTAHGPKQMQCILCKGLGPTWCGKWYKTKRAEEWERDHRAHHLQHHADLDLRIEKTVRV